MAASSHVDHDPTARDRLHKVFMLQEPAGLYAPPPCPRGGRGKYGCCLSHIRHRGTEWGSPNKVGRC